MTDAIVNNTHSPITSEFHVSHRYRYHGAGT